MSRVKVGDVVRLSTEWHRRMRLPLAYRQTMRITRVDSENLTDDCETYTVEVDDPEANRFMLTDHDFDVVAAKGSP